MDSNPLWYKTAIVYQLHVRSFFDSNSDGIGDFAGLTQKLDYLEELGVTALWLLPFYPSPLKDDGYDISDYRQIHPSYGSLDDFRVLLREAHRRGLRVITELVLNHTSDQHPWFQRARQAEVGSTERNYYVWSDSSEKYPQARVIFQDYETSNWSWDPLAHAYYWHRFFAHQPDLNFDNTAVQDEIASVLDYWLHLGVDGLRLDGVPYLYEREGTSCENLPETHAFLKMLREGVDSKFTGRMFLAEANQWPEDASAYFGDGDECHTVFHFPLMPRMYLAVLMEDRFPILDILNQTPAIPENCQWMLFLRNHDELTLEMVTERERDYMYRFYASDPQARLNLGIRRRLAPLLDNDRRKIELLNSLLLSLPGTPIIYYGDEIGMGDNIYLGDRNGVRTPMQWSADRNAGFSQANPQKLYLPPIIDYQYHYETVNVETMQGQPNSLLSWMQRLIRLRRELRPLAEGTLEFLHPENHKVLAFLRRCPSADGQGEEQLLVVANLSHSAQFVELDLSAYREKTPVEVLGRIRFPRIGELPYLLTLTPYAFYWFVLQSDETAALKLGTGLALPHLTVPEQWEAVFNLPVSEPFEQALLRFITSSRWHRHLAEHVQRISVLDVFSFAQEVSQGQADPLERRETESETVTESSSPGISLVLTKIEYEDAPEAVYVIPIGFRSEAHERLAESIEAPRTIARIKIEHDRLGENGILCDAFGESDFCRWIFEAVGSRCELKGREGKLLAWPTREFDRFRAELEEPARAGNHLEAQNNSVVVYGDRILIKLFRHLEGGIHPEVEMGRYLVEHSGFTHVAPVLGAIEYQAENHPSVTVGLLQGFVEHEQNAWEYTLDTLESFLKNVGADRQTECPCVGSLDIWSLLERTEFPLPEMAQDWFGTYLRSVDLLGQRTAELHETLAAPTENRDFSPDRLLPFHLRSLYQSVRNLLGRDIRLLRKLLPDLSDELQPSAKAILDQDFERLLGHEPGKIGMHRAFRMNLVAMRIRCHGNYGLEDVLCSEGDFFIVDFEGDSDLPITQRRIKSSPLRDVAGMLWSFQRAGKYALKEYASTVEADDPELARLGCWIDLWKYWTSITFVRAYLDRAGTASFVPQPREVVQPLLNLYLAEKGTLTLLRDLEKLSPTESTGQHETYLSMQQILELLKSDQTPSSEA